MASPQVAAGSPGACDAVCARLMPHLLRLVLGGGASSASTAPLSVQRPDGGGAAGASEGLTLAALHMLLRGVREGLAEMPPAPAEDWRPFKVLVRLRALVSLQGQGRSLM